MAQSAGWSRNFCTTPETAAFPGLEDSKGGALKSCASRGRGRGVGRNTTHPPAEHISSAMTLYVLMLWTADVSNMWQTPTVFVYSKSHTGCFTSKHSQCIHSFKTTDITVHLQGAHHQERNPQSLPMPFALHCLTHNTAHSDDQGPCTDGSAGGEVARHNGLHTAQLAISRVWFKPTGTL